MYFLMQKADFIDKKVAYPDYTYNNTYLDILYKDVKNSFLIEIGLFYIDIE